jgi:hypothetical protein
LPSEDLSKYWGDASSPPRPFFVALSENAPADVNGVGLISTDCLRGEEAVGRGLALLRLSSGTVARE